MLSQSRRAIPLILKDTKKGLSSRIRPIAELYDLFNDLGRRIHFLIGSETVFRQSEACQRIAKLKALVLKRLATACCCYWQKELNLEWSYFCMAGSGSRQHSVATGSA